MIGYQGTSIWVEKTESLEMQKGPLRRKRVAQKQGTNFHPSQYCPGPGMNLTLIHRLGVHSFRKSVNTASSSKTTGFPHTLAGPVFKENVRPEQILSNKEHFVGADRALSSALVLLRDSSSPTALPPEPRPLSLVLWAIQSLLQHFVISREHFRPIFSFLISLIDFLNYVSAQRCLKKKTS